MLHAMLLLFIVLCVAGLILWGITQIPGLPQIVKVVVYVVVGVGLLLWLYQIIASGGMPMALK